MAQHRLKEHRVVGDVEVGELVVGQQYADDVAGVTADAVLHHQSVCRGDVVGTGTGQGAGEADIRITLGYKSRHTHGGLATLGVADVEEVVAPGVAHVGQQHLGGQQGVDTGLRVDGRDTVGLVFRFGGTEAVVVGRDGDEWAAGQRFLDGEFAARGALVCAIYRKVVVEYETHG